MKYLCFIVSLWQFGLFLFPQKICAQNNKFFRRMLFEKQVSFFWNSHILSDGEIYIQDSFRVCSVSFSNWQVLIFANTRANSSLFQRVIFVHQFNDSVSRSLHIGSDGRTQKYVLTTKKELIYETILMLSDSSCFQMNLEDNPHKRLYLSTENVLEVSHLFNPLQRQYFSGFEQLTTRILKNYPTFY